MLLSERKRNRAHSLHALGAADDSADVNAPNWHGTTSLMRAASAGHAQTVKRLLAHGAAPSVLPAPPASPHDA